MSEAPTVQTEPGGFQTFCSPTRPRASRATLARRLERLWPAAMEAVVGQAGKTLVETMTIVAVLGLAAMMTAEAFLPASRHNQAQAVRAELAGELRLARQLAMARRQTMRVRLEAGRSRLTVEAVQGGGTVLRAFDFSNKAVVVDSVSNGPEILFYGSGRAATPTSVTLRSADDGKFYTLTVSITGRVTLK